MGGPTARTSSHRPPRKPVSRNPTVEVGCYTPFLNTLACEVQALDHLSRTVRDPNDCRQPIPGMARRPSSARARCDWTSLRLSPARSSGAAWREALGHGRLPCTAPDAGSHTRRYSPPHSLPRAAPAKSGPATASFGFRSATFRVGLPLASAYRPCEQHLCITSNSPAAFHSAALSRWVVPPP